MSVWEKTGSKACSISSTTDSGRRKSVCSFMAGQHTHTHTHTQKRKRFTSLTIAATTQKTEPIKLLPEITLFSYFFPHLFRNLLFNRKEGNLVKCSELNESFLLDILSLNLIPFWLTARHVPETLTRFGGWNKRLNFAALGWCHVPIS